jgi:hypothetical protein
MYELPHAYLVRALCEGLQKGLSVADACTLAGIRQSTYDRWIKQGEAEVSPFHQLMLVMKSAQAEGRRRVLRTIRRARRQHWQASAWLLARTDPEHWRSDAVQRGGMEDGSIGAGMAKLAEFALPFIPAERQAEFRREVEELIAAQGERGHDAWPPGDVAPAASHRWL